MLNEESGILVSDGDLAVTRIATIPDLLLHSTHGSRKPDAFRFKRNGQWVDVSTDEFLLRVENLFFALRALGLKPHDRVAIISENRVEWAIADYASLCAGGVTVPVYPTLSPSQMEGLLQNCDPTIVFVSTPELLKKISNGYGWSATHVVVFEPGAHPAGVLTLESLSEMGSQYAGDYRGEFRRVAKSIDENDVATIIYTSGATGTPKGAMLTHRNLMSNILATNERLPIHADDVNLSFLPLSHIFQRHVDYASLRAGATTAYAQNVSTVADDMLDVRPTFTSGVPRFFEKVYARIMSEVSASPAFVRMVFERAMGIGRERLRSGRNSLAAMAADHVVFKKIRDGMGGRLRFLISGGAALEKEIAEFFWLIGLPVYEGYGLSETSPVITLNGPDSVRLGTVGKVIGDQELRIDMDGEILVRGSNVMQGYYKLPVETSQAFAGGWFHTGDVGEIDTDGFLKITDRKKDLIITSSGKKVAPQPIENRLKLIPYFDHVVLVGDGRSYLSALIVPNRTALAAYARSRNISTEESELMSSPEIHDLAMAEIVRRTADLAPFEQVRKIAFLEGAFSIDGGELTPTLKIRRSVIEKKYKPAIDQLYAA